MKGGVTMVSLCVGLVQTRHRMWSARVAEVPDGHDQKCDGSHGRPWGRFGEVGFGVCVRCGDDGAVLFVPQGERQDLAACKQCVCDYVIACYLVAMYELHVGLPRSWGVGAGDFSSHRHGGRDERATTA